jgi:hypothetical protein
MRADITYHWAKDHLRIDLGDRTDTRIKIFYWIELFFTVALATVFMAQAFPLKQQWIHWFTVTGAGVLYILAAVRFLSRISQREQLILTPHHFTIVRRSLITRGVQHYQWRYMGPLHYLGKDQKTDHPLKGISFDYFGFETNEHFIQNLHRDGSMYFHYHNCPVRFGRFVYSWHAEEIVSMMKLYIGNELQLGAEWKRMVQEQEWD